MKAAVSKNAGCATRTISWSLRCELRSGVEATMRVIELFYPVAALAFWTFLVLHAMGFSRVRAVLKGRARISEFAYGETERVPERIRRTNRNVINLLEVPLLFYVGCLFAMFLGSVSSTLVLLAWVYFALRVLHSLIHLTTNNILHRASVYGASNLVVVAIWLVLVIGAPSAA